MSESGGRTFSRAMKLAAIARMDAGENVSALSRELGVKREILYRWRALYRAGGEEHLRERRGRPTAAETRAMTMARGPDSEAAELAAARRRIAELERKAARQQLELEFLQRLLRHFEGLGQPSEPPGATASSRRPAR